MGGVIHITDSDAASSGGELVFFGIRESKTSGYHDYRLGK